jgi:malonyl-CoA O-methyltransferase
MKISLEFSKHANEYELHNIIQKKVIQKLLTDLSVKPNSILDLGCGSGALCESIPWKYKHFVGVDFAPGMLELHPKSKKIEAIYGDFNDKTLFENLATYEFDHIFSASALQWAEDLEAVFANIASLHKPVSLAIFTSGTFKTLNETASIKPLLRDKEEIDRIQKRYFDGTMEVVKYTLAFESVREMFRYIKRSGVSGSRNLLSYQETKKLMKEYPLNFLEFEVVFIRTTL